MDMSLDQIIKNEKSQNKGTTSRARRRTSNRTLPSSSSSSRRESGVKFIARLDIDKAKSKRARLPKKTIPITSTSTTTTATTLSTPPPLKITIQNNAKPKPNISPKLSSRREERVRDNDRPSFDRIKVSKSIGQKKSTILSRGRRNNNVNGNNSYNNNNHNESSRRQFGDGPSLFERNTHIPNNRGPSGKNLQLFTGSRLDLANLHHDITTNDLRTLFEKMGEIKTIKINYDKSGRSEGTGYVVFSKDADARMALDRYNGAKLDGKHLDITRGHSLQDDIRFL